MPKQLLYPIHCCDCGAPVQRTGLAQKRCPACAAVQKVLMARLRKKEQSIRKADAVGRTYKPHDPANPYRRPSWAERRAAGALDRQRARRGSAPLDEYKLQRLARAKDRQVKLRIDKLKAMAARIQAKIDFVEAKPWRAEGLCLAERYRLRYEHDPAFRDKEIRRSARMKAERRAKRTAGNPGRQSRQSKRGTSVTAMPSPR